VKLSEKGVIHASENEDGESVIQQKTRMEPATQNTEKKRKEKR